MTDKELNYKLGAMHLRLLDDEENYARLMEEMMDYSDLVEDYGSAVVSALSDGLENRERFLAMEKALSKVRLRASSRASSNSSSSLHHRRRILRDTPSMAAASERFPPVALSTFSSCSISGFL